MSDPRSAAESLARVPLFADLAAEPLAEVERALRRRRYPKGSLVHAAGAMGADLYIVASGRVKVALLSGDGDELALRLLGPYDFFGEISLLDGQPWYADAVAADECELLLLAAGEFVRLLDQHPAVSRRLLMIVCGRLRQNAAFACDLAFLDVPTRLARTLVRMTLNEGWGWTDTAHEAEGGLLRVTQAELASYVGATRESVNKWLAFFERRGDVRCGRDQITILRPGSLRARAGVG